MRRPSDSSVKGLPVFRNLVHRWTSGRRRVAVPLLLAGICVLALPLPSRGQVLGAEAYYYGDIPIPAHVIADDFIERVVIPKLSLPRLLALWFEAKDAAQPVDQTIEEYFKASGGNVSEDQRQNYLSRLLLLKQLRYAIVVYEQLPLTPEAYSARFGERGFPPASERTKYLAKAATFSQEGDRPQEATLKAAVSLLHERDRRDGVPVIHECHFENPQSRMQPYCTLEISQTDGMFRDVIFAERYPLDGQAVKLLAEYTRSSEEMIRSRSSIIDTLQILIRGTVPPPAEDFRLHRNAAILNALKQSEDYQAALESRESRLPPAQRPRTEQDPVASFVAGMLTVAIGIGMFANEQVALRAERNAQDPVWRGHEKDHLCYIMNEYSVPVFGVPTLTDRHTYCYAYDGRFGSARDHCRGVQGWCRGR